jgi:hypothetical protein
MSFDEELTLAVFVTTIRHHFHHYSLKNAKFPEHGFWDNYA